MLTVFIAICALSLPVDSCDKATAIDWIVAPQRQASPAGCMIHGQQYAAQSRLIVEETYPKVFCRRAGGKPAVPSR